MTTGVESLAARLGEVRERIDAACGLVARDASGVTLIGVTKGQPAEVVVEASRAGLHDMGENRVQEGIEKMARVRTLLGGAGEPAWHLVGHLQTNKARDAAGCFAILHAVDSGRLLRALGERAEQRVRVFIQVNVSGEATKFGCDPGELDGLLAQARGYPHVQVTGLMTVAPMVQRAEDVRPVFRELARLAQKHGLVELSMGMTDDFEVAIEEGATHVRVGRGIFGERPA